MLKRLFEKYFARKARAFFEVGYALEAGRLLQQAKESPKLLSSAIPPTYMVAAEAGALKARLDLQKLLKLPDLKYSSHLSAETQLLDQASIDAGWNACILAIHEYREPSQPSH